MSYWPCRNKGTFQISICYFLYSIYKSIFECDWNFKILFGVESFQTCVVEIEMEKAPALVRNVVPTILREESRKG